MGRLAPWVKYQYEWRDILDQRKPTPLTNRLNDDSTTECTLDGREKKELQTFWLPEKLSAWLPWSSSRPKPYSDQTQSLLTQLPREVRHMIWVDVLRGGHKIRIVRKMNKLGHFVLPRDQTRLDTTQRGPKGDHWFPLLGTEKRYKDDEVLAAANLLPLLRSCKLM